MVAHAPPEAAERRLHAVPGPDLRPSGSPEMRPSRKIRIDDVLVGCINVLGQTRPGENAQQAALTGSIARRGLINPVNIAILTPDLMDEYVRWTNQTWGTDVLLGALTPLGTDYIVGGQIVARAGEYAQLVAGHSRLKGVKQAAVDADRDPNLEYIPAQLNRPDNLVSLLADQVEENIHCEVPILRNLRAIAEMYRYQKSIALEKARQDVAAYGGTVNPRRIGPTQEEFAKSFGIKSGLLSLALHYADLPPLIRDLTEGKSERLGLELARALPVMILHASFLIDNDPGYAELRWRRTRSRAAREADLDRQDRRADLVEAIVQEEMVVLLQRINNMDTNAIFMGVSLIRNYANELRKRYRPEKDRATMQMDSLFELQTDVDGHRERIREQVARLIADYAMGEQHRRARVTRAIANAAGVEVPSEAEEADLNAFVAALAGDVEAAKVGRAATSSRGGAGPVEAKVAS
ncbi:MAG TPA: hypothetical protein VGS28_02260 [Candidatus Saccharimonadales bacterium]|nr:hypothetical protein [Candidatus Saccharimonadales bacterium]